MAYFSNGSEGYSWEEDNCDVCHFGTDDRLCSVRYIQNLWNYDQLKAGNEELHKAMNFLIPEKDGHPQKCSMFIPVGGLVDE